MDNSDENSPLKSAAIAALLGVPSRTYTRTRDAHPIYQMVGQVASEWAHLEHLLDELIWRLAEVRRADGACITAQLMGATPRYKTLIAQLTHLSKTKPHLLQFVDAVKKLMGRTYDIQDQRNRIIHDPWYVATVTSLSGHGSPAQFKSMPAKELEFGIKDVDVEADPRSH